MAALEQPSEHAPEGNAHRSVLRFRREDGIVLLLWAACLGLIEITTPGHPSFVPTWSSYVAHFAGYIALVFPLSRLYFLAERHWKPRAALGRRARGLLWDPTPARLDRLWFGPLSRRATPRTCPVLLIDLELARGVALLLANLAVYTNVKVRIPFFRGQPADSWFAAADEWLVGADLATSLEELFAASPLVRAFFDDVYMHHYLWMVVLAVILYLRRDAFSLRWLFASAAVTYTVGILISAALPSLGPVFLEPGRFDWAAGTRVGKAQAFLALHFNDALNALRQGAPPNTVPFAGIAAFPSLHVGHMVVVLWVALRTVPIYAFWMAIVTVATTFATIGFGWHWVVDAPGGALVAVLCTEGVLRLLGRPPDHPSSPQSTRRMRGASLRAA